MIGGGGDQYDICDATGPSLDLLTNEIGWSAVSELRHALRDAAGITFHCDADEDAALCTEADHVCG